MFSLIITIISIALVVGLAIATIFYGGDVFVESGKDANYARIVNEINQVKGAMAMRKVDHVTPPATLDDLIPKYMSSLPAGWDAGSRDGYLTLTLGDTSLETCLRVNEELNVENPGGEPPACPASPNDVFTGCCVTAD